MPKSVIFRGGGLVGALVLSSQVIAAVPSSLQTFTSTSGKTAIAYFEYDAGPCAGGAACDFRGLITVPKGFARADVFVAGFTLQTTHQSDAVSQVSVRAAGFNYDSAQGALDVGVGAVLATRSGQPYSYRLTFVVLLTQPTAAAFSLISTGCSGIASCTISRSLPNAVPAGMQYIGLGTRLWSLGSQSGPVLINTLAGYTSSLTVSPPAVTLDYGCEIHARGAKNRMYCEWTAAVIAFDPAEMQQNGSGLFPQYTFLSLGTTTHPQWANHSTSPTHAPIKGFLDGFEGLILSYQTFPYHPPTNFPIWQIDSSATKFAIDPTAADTAVTNYGVFLGTRFGNSTLAQEYLYQESRAFGFLR